MNAILKTSVGLSFGFALLTGGAGVLAQDGAPKKSYVLEDGTIHSNPGEMFQYLRIRDNGLAAGNPKDIVEAYPDEFENVGDLIHQKRTAE